MRVTKYLLIISASLLMLWHPAKIYFGDETYNLFITKTNTFAQPIRWYVFFTHVFVEKTILISILYYHLSKTWRNIKFIVPFIVYNVYCIFEYWFFAFYLDRYIIIITVIIISSILYAKYKPYKYSK